MQLLKDLPVHCAPKETRILCRSIRDFLKDHSTCASEACELIACLRLRSDQHFSRFGDFLLPFSILSEFVAKLDDGHDEFRVLVHSWCRLASLGLLDRSDRRRSFIRNACIKMWDKNPSIRTSVVEYIKVSELSRHSLALSSAFAMKLSDDASPTSTSYLVDNLLKAMFVSKVNIPESDLPMCTGVISTCVNPEVFKSTVMPALHRAILRSAEANMHNSYIGRADRSLGLWINERILKWLRSRMGSIMAELSELQNLAASVITRHLLSTVHRVNPDESFTILMRNQRHYFIWLLEEVDAVLHQVSFGLDHCAVELATPIASHLLALLDSVRNATIKVLSTIVKHCSEANSISEVCKLVHALISGSEGRKAGQEVRFAGLTCLGELSNHGASQKAVVDRVGTAAVGFIVEYLEHESHDDTLIHGARQLVKWIQRFKSSVPDRLFSFLKTICFNSEVSPTVRCAFLVCLDDAFSKVNIEDRLTPTLQASLLKTIQHAVGQPNHSPLVSESVCASLIWMRHFLASTKSLSEDSVKSSLTPTPIWTLLVVGSAPAFKRKPWFSERFLQTAPDYILSKLGALLALFLRGVNQFISQETCSGIYRILVLLANHPCYATVRQPTLACIRCLVHGDSGNARWAHAKGLLHSLSDCLFESDDDLTHSRPRMDSLGIVFNSNRELAEPTSSTHADNVNLRVWDEAVVPTHPIKDGKYPRSFGTYSSQLVMCIATSLSNSLLVTHDSPQSVSDVPKSLADDSLNAVPSDALRNLLDIYLACLLPTCHQIVELAVPGLWDDVRRCMGFPTVCDGSHCASLVGDEYFASKWAEIVQYFLQLPCLDFTHSRALERLVTWSPLGFARTLLSAILPQLSRPELILVSHREVQIMLTSNTQLFNQELLESLPRYQKSRKIDPHFDQPLDTLPSKNRRDETTKPPNGFADQSILEVLGGQLTEKQLESVRAELIKEEEVRQRMFQLDKEARLLSCLLSTTIQACISKPMQTDPTLAHSVGTLAVDICCELSTSLTRLLGSVLTAPYFLRCYVHSVSLMMQCALNRRSGLLPKSGKVDSACEHLVGWWSLRILGPARLLSSPDLVTIAKGFGNWGNARLFRTHLYTLESAVADAASLTACWSMDSLADQTTRLVNFIQNKFPHRDANASLLYSFLCPTFELLLLASGWARPLHEELSNLPFPTLQEGYTATDESGASYAVHPEIRKMWNWVTPQHAKNLMICWLTQLRPPSLDGATLPVDGLFYNVVLRSLPFSRLFALARQVVEGALCDENAYSGETDHNLIEELEEPQVTRTFIRKDEMCPIEHRELARSALDVLRCTTELLTDALTAVDLPDKLYYQIAFHSLDSLLYGTVAETALARESCLQCILTLLQRIPSFVDKASSFQSDSTQSDAVVITSDINTQAETQEPESVQSTEDSHAPDRENVQPPRSQDTSTMKKKLNKTQRRKQKLAQVAADLRQAQGDSDLPTTPYKSPAFWPPLSIWAKLQLRLWVARSDLSPEAACLAEKLWATVGLDTACEQPVPLEESTKLPIARLLDSPTIPSLLRPLSLAKRLLLESTRPIPSLQKANADALALCLLLRTSDEVAVSLHQLIHLYRAMLHREPAVTDSVGRILVPESPDLWRERFGLALALSRLPEVLTPCDTAYHELRRGLYLSDADDAEHIPSEQEDGNTCMTDTGPDRPASAADTWIIDMFRFLVPDGLNDRNAAVRSRLLQAGLRAVAICGKSHFGQLLPILELFLNKAPNVAELDAVRQSVLILTASLSQHLAADDPKVWNIFSRLLTTLSFPSDVVQQAVEDCLASLVLKLTEEQRSKTVTRLLSTLLGSPSFAERHGAAHGIAGVVRGLGIMSLKQYGIIDKILPALEDGKSGKRREGALLSIERLCLGMGRLFEPYVIRLISGLLNAFGDANPSVREAAWNAARAIMSKLSAHGVRLVLPALLRAIDSEQSWRTKAQSVELLATMTHCAPKQLSACLPQIVPRLLEVLVTSQEQLKEAGTRALQHIGNVIRNPEVQALVPLLTNCLQDPLADRMPCLLALRDTCFVHVLDAPSLALILPVIQRAFTDRNTEARKTAAQIFGNLHSLARKEELQPYVANILPPLKSCLLDAVPEVRSVAAAALGSLVRGMGEPCFKEVLPWLLDTLTCESSSVDRSGAAQGLAEVLGAMGIDRLRSILPDLIRTASSDMKVLPHVRDGYLMLFIYLPAVFKDAFSEFIGPVVPTILKSLSDETEFLRETALKAAQRIVRMFADSSVELLLPEFERGMGDSNWRIRHASVQLVGDLLYQLSGYSGKGTTKTHDEDDTFGTNEAHEHLKQMMGLERHDRVLARLHIARSDPTSVVRQSAVHVWKVIVPNTSRTLREIMPTLVRLILSILGAPNREQQQLAARSLGDVVRKLGERILPEIIPLLLQILDSPDPDGRRGVCNGLMEIIRNCPREQLTNYTDVLLVPVRRALCDELPEVRRSGARAFELLHNILGLRSLEGILPDLMSLLDDSESNPYALDGLRQLLVVKGKAVMPYLIPKLIYPTVNVKAFAYLASVAGESLSRQLGRILPALLTLVSQSNEQRTDEDVGHCAEVLICVYDLTGVRYILNALLTGIGPASTQSAPTTFGQVVPGTVAYRLACLRLLSAYLEISFDACDMSIGHDAVIAASGKDRDITKSDDGEEESDDYRSEDYSDEDEDDSEETDSDDDDMLDNENDEPPDAKESVSKVLREFYPLALRNLCRLLAFRDEAVLVYCWKCLESLVKRWSPETLSTQINDLRQGIRGAASESHKSTPSKNSKDFLPGLSDPKLPVTVLVKLFADCILRGHPDIKEPASQALLECITHASGPALQSSVIKVLGPLIRLLGERQTNVVRASVVESLTALVTKCPHSARPFVTQLQTTFLKCLGDTHRPIRLLGGRGLASLVELTPRLDLLLSDLSRFSTNAVLSSLPSGHLPAGLNLQEFAPTLGTAATALTQTGIAKYPETSLQALRLCLLGSSGKASMSTLDSILSMLSPLMFIQDSGSNKPGLIDDSEPCDEDSDVENSSYETDDSARGKVAAVNFEAIRVVSSVCMGCAVAAANSTLRRQSGDAPVSAESMGCLVDMLQRTVFVHSVKPERWTHLHSKAIFLLVVLNHAPMAVINEHSIHSGFLKNMEDFLAKLCLNDQSEVWQLGYRCIGSYLGHTVETPEAHHDCRQPMSLLTSGIKHSAIETRLLVTTVVTHVSWRWKLADPACSEHSSELSLSMFLSLLLVGSRDKVSGVRQSAEAAVAVLTRLGGHANKESNAAIKVCLDALDAGNRSQLDSLLQRLRKQSWAEVYSRGCPNMDSISTSLCS